MKQNILIVSGDPYFENSVMNKRILEILKEKLPQAKFDQLDTLYPDYQIDEKVEQKKLMEADTIVVVSPIYWYNFTSLLRKWLEVIIAPGWAYGPNGYALEGKNIILSLTGGASEASYTPGPNCILSKEQTLAPLAAVFDYCKMNNAGIIFSMGINKGEKSDEEWHEFIENGANNQVNNIIEAIQSCEK